MGSPLALPAAAALRAATRRAGRAAQRRPLPGARPQNLNVMISRGSDGLAWPLPTLRVLPLKPSLEIVEQAAFASAFVSATSSPPPLFPKFE